MGLTIFSFRDFDIFLMTGHKENIKIPKGKNSDPLFSLIPPTSKNHNFFKKKYFYMKSFLEQRYMFIVFPKIETPRLHAL